MNVESGEQVSQPVLSIRAKVSEQDLPGHVAASFGKIAAYLDEMGIKPGGPPYLAYYHLDPENPGGNGTWEIEAGFPVPVILPGRGEIIQTYTAAGRSVSCLYKGPYTGLGKAYRKLSEWVQQKGEHTRGISYEYLLNSPSDVPEEELLTRVVWILE